MSACRRAHYCNLFGVNAVFFGIRPYVSYSAPCIEQGSGKFVWADSVIEHENVKSARVKEFGIALALVVGKIGVSSAGADDDGSVTALALCGIEVKNRICFSVK